MEEPMSVDAQAAADEEVIVEMPKVYQVR